LRIAGVQVSFIFASNQKFKISDNFNPCIGIHEGKRQRVLRFNFEKRPYLDDFASLSQFLYQKKDEIGLKSNFNQGIIKILREIFFKKNE